MMKLQFWLVIIMYAYSLLFNGSCARSQESTSTKVVLTIPQDFNPNPLAYKLAQLDKTTGVLQVSYDDGRPAILIELSAGQTYELELARGSVAIQVALLVNEGSQFNEEWSPYWAAERFKLDQQEQVVLLSLIKARNYIGGSFSGRITNSAGMGTTGKIQYQLKIKSDMPAIPLPQIPGDIFNGWLQVYSLYSTDFIGIAYTDQSGLNLFGPNQFKHHFNLKSSNADSFISDSQLVQLGLPYVTKSNYFYNNQTASSDYKIVKNQLPKIYSLGYWGPDQSLKKVVNSFELPDAPTQVYGLDQFKSSNVAGTIVTPPVSNSLVISEWTSVQQGLGLLTLQPVIGEMDVFKGTDQVRQRGGVNEPAQSINPKEIALGATHTCYLNNLNELYCWGSNLYGQVAQNLSLSSVLTYEKVNVSLKFKKIYAGGFHTCGIDENNKLYCWGRNNNGQLGVGQAANSSTPIVVDGNESYQALALGFNHSCGITLGGVLKCWGLNSNGQIGNGTATNQLLPVTVDAGVLYRQVSAGQTHSCGITTLNQLKCWGSATMGKLGEGSTSGNQLSPQIIDSTSNYKSVSAGGEHTCAIRDDHHLFCWGANLEGQLGIGNTTGMSSPQEVSASVTYFEVVTGLNHTCAITEDKMKMQCWGDGSKFANGNYNGDDSSAPSDIFSSQLIHKIAVGLFHSCSIVGSWNALYCWGDNEFDQINGGVNRLNLYPYSHYIEGNKPFVTNIKNQLVYNPYPFYGNIQLKYAGFNGIFIPARWPLNLNQYRDYNNLNYLQMIPEIQVTQVVVYGSRQEQSPSEFLSCKDLILNSSQWGFDQIANSLEASSGLSINQQTNQLHFTNFPVSYNSYNSLDGFRFLVFCPTVKDQNNLNYSAHKPIVFDTDLLSTGP